MKIEKDTRFDPNAQQPWTLFPNVFHDGRGSFTEVLKSSDVPYLDIVRQINRSVSRKGTFRGFHAQKAPFCQAKLVEALTVPIYDIIVDARPDSRTFGKSACYLLDPAVQNKVYVPHGFLHSFFVPDDGQPGDAVFMYYCDKMYDRTSEVPVNPKSVLAEILDDECNAELRDILDPSKLVLSDKDLASQDFKTFMRNVKDEWLSSGKLWHLNAG